MPVVSDKKMRTYKRKTEEDLDCGIYLASKIFGGKWKCCILDAISKGISRPSDIHSYIPNVSKRVIEIQLAELLFYGVVERNTEDIYPKRTDYSLTQVGKSILPILGYMDEWGLAHADLIKERVSELLHSE
jgi:DNA-binding HxlR family transcriptional regulator